MSWSHEPFHWVRTGRPIRSSLRAQRSNPYRHLLSHGLLRFARNDDKHKSVFSRHDLPESCQTSPSKEEEGAGNAGCWPHPWPACKGRKQAAVTTGKAETTGIPCAMVLTAYSALSPE